MENLLTSGADCSTVNCHCVQAHNSTPNSHQQSFIYWQCIKQNGILSEFAVSNFGKCKHPIARGHAFYGQLSFWANVFWAKMSFWENVFLGKLLWADVS
jgi:hypothetical protein